MSARKKAEEELKSRLETSKQELAMIQDQLQRTQVKAELNMENQRLKDENGALIRVITKLSK
ncbi:hypothetical protein F7725_017389 [Dissostichus mawsoni]|uniref:cGMP-dependent protein kinase interacting domain-containing protein n=1 Tax=Dissostichus mawsoni TaxID=36200 RepID=A0A7J5Z4Y8_DISMA|nr:hypothetical protein F7725_017389 [Dissostichus mawsoni]